VESLQIQPLWVCGCRPLKRRLEIFPEPIDKPHHRSIEYSSFNASRPGLTSSPLCCSAAPETTPAVYPETELTRAGVRRGVGCTPKYDGASLRLLNYSGPFGNSATARAGLHRHPSGPTLMACLYTLRHARCGTDGQAGKRTQCEATRSRGRHPFPSVVTG
jgi:hypothetical protein